MVHTRPQHSCHWRLSTCPTVKPRAVSWRRIKCQASVTGGDNLLHVGVCWKSLVIEVLLKGSKGMESDCVTDGRFWTMQPTATNLNPKMFISLNSLRSIWLASDLQQMPTWSKLSPAGYRHLIPIMHQSHDVQHVSTDGNTGSSKEISSERLVDVLNRLHCSLP
jgi:hypothetical protein